MVDQIRQQPGNQVVPIQQGQQQPVSQPAQQPGQGQFVDPNNALVAEFTRLLGQQQALAQNQPQRETGFLGPNQQGVRDVITNPTTDQLTALLTSLVTAANPSARSPLLAGFAGGAGALQQARERRFQQRQQAFQQQNESVQQRLENVGRLANISGDIQDRGLARSRLGIQQQQEQRASGLQTTLNLVDQQGNILGQVFQDPNQRIFQRVNGQDIDVTEQIANNPRLNVAPLSSGGVNITNRIGGEDLSDLVDQGAVKNLNEKLRPEAQQGAQQVLLADRLIELAPQVNTGAGADIITDFKSLAQTGLREVGLDSLANRVETVNTAQELRGLASSAILPFVGSRAFSDGDRKITQEAFPSLRNSPQANVALGNLMKAQGIAKQEEFNFTEEAIGRAARGERQSTTGISREFQQFVQDVPRLTLSEDSIPTAVETNGQPIWQYWIGGRPKKFIVNLGGESRELSLSEFKAAAERDGIPFREALSIMERKGQIIGVER